MLNNSDIRYDNPEYMLYDPGEPFYGRDKYSNLLSINDEEYENAIQAYIETPISKDSYLFHIQDLRASERKWLGGMIAIKKCGDVSHIKMKYKILSNNTSGDIEGELIYNGKIRG